MQRRTFIRNSMALAAAGPAVLAASQPANSKFPVMKADVKAPRAISMWDFSWLERRWPGAGYEDWDQALDQLVERGYNALRIDAYPHLLAANPEREYTLLPVWNTQIWGSPDIIRVQVQPALSEFIAKCRDRDIRVALSSWYREDADNLRMKIDGPERMAENWIKTLRLLERDGLLGALLYVDLCNEWPGDIWCPFFTNDPPEQTWGFWHTEKSMRYMRTSVQPVRQAFPSIPVCYSFTGGQPALYAERDLSFFDLIEHHTWLAQLNDGEYDKAVGYNYTRFSPEGYQQLVANHERVYREREMYWREQLVKEIQLVGRSAKAAAQPLVTTECWGIVDFKDWPMLKWDVVKELCELGVQTAVATGQWLAIATCNFAGPQFTGLWRDMDWHLKLTSMIRNSTPNPELSSSKLAGRL